MISNVDADMTTNVGLTMSTDVGRSMTTNQWPIFSNALIFHMILYVFHMFFIYFYMILYNVHMILYDLYMILYGFLYDFIWFLYDFILFYLIFGGCGRNFRMTRFFEFWTFDRKFQRSTGNSNVRPEIRGTTAIFGWPVFFWILNVRPEIRRATEVFGWPVFFEFWKFDRKFDVPPKFSDDPFFFNFERSTGNSTYHRNFRMTRFF